MRAHWWLPLIVLLGLALPFIGKPAHIDDPNFLALARGAAADPWRPHAVLINWQGTTEPAFQVLSNPPGIAWWLAPVAHAPVQLQHLWMLPWLALAVWGAHGLGAALTGQGAAAALLIVGSPVGLWATGALTPDLPLLACVLAGMREVVGGRRARLGAVIVGCAALFRYSGLALAPVAAAWAWFRGDRREAVVLGGLAVLPSAALAAHDLHAYGAVHLIAMTGFQSVSNGPDELAHKALAALAMLGGAGALPVLCFARRRAWVGLAVGLIVGAPAAVLLAGFTPTWWLTLLFFGAGGAALGAVVGWRDATDRVLLVWAGLGLVFLLTLRFMATRYWLPFLPPVVLAPLRFAGPRLQAGAIFASLGLGAALLVDDLELARAQHDAAVQVAADAAERGEAPGLFAGHWGWQGALEAAGWRAIEDEAEIPPGVLFAGSEMAWPQLVGGCDEEVSFQALPDRWPGPRVLTRAGAANFHSFVFPPDKGVERTYAPWGFGHDALDTIEVTRGVACP